MPTFKLAATPATRLLGKDFVSTQMDLLANVVPPVTVEAKNLTEIAEEILLFGKKVAVERPGVSFRISVIPMKGQRKPRGFDAAYKSGAIYNEAWLHTAIEHPTPHADGPGVRMWGSRFTPFQLDGLAPFGAPVAADEFGAAADGSLGLYGYLRAINALVQRRTDGMQNLLSIVHEVPLRDRYAASVHPLDVAAELLAGRLSPTSAAA